jgi:hypothetical protein
VVGSDVQMGNVQADRRNVSPAAKQRAARLHHGCATVGIIALV